MTSLAGSRDARARSDRLARTVRELVKAGRWHRRLLASGLVAAGMAFGLNAIEPPPPPSVPVVTAARDLEPGTRLVAADVTTTKLTPGTVPDGAVGSEADTIGRTLVSAARRGEPLTDLRLVGAASTTGNDAVLAPVRIADAEAVALLRPGDIVDVLGAGLPVEGSATTSARLLASAVRVVTVPRREDDSGITTVTGEGALLVVTTTASTAARLAGAAVTDRLSVVLRGRG